MRRYGKGGYHRIITGAVFIGVSFLMGGFGGMRHAPGGGFFRLVFLWVGVFSLIRGASDILSDYLAVRKRKSDPDIANRKKIERDGTILRIARKNGGFVSVSEAAKHPWNLASPLRHPKRSLTLLFPRVTHQWKSQMPGR